MITRVYLVRHAEVENPNGIEYMRLPGFGLSNFGIKQAHRLAEYFSSKGITHIFASPLKRTKETAQIISRGKLKVRYYDEFLEANYKKWQGVKKCERDPKDVAGYTKNPIKYSAILGESVSDIQNRVVDRIYELVKKCPGENIIIVTHAAPVVVAQLFFENKSLMEFNKTWVDFGSVTTITFDDELRCRGVDYGEIVKQREDRNE